MKISPVFLMFLASVGLNAKSAMASEIKNCKITFETIGKPVLVQIKGQSDEPCVGSYTLAGNQLTAAEFKMKLDKIETGIPLRNKHLRENYLHTDKFPEAVISVKKIDGLDQQRGSKGAKMDNYYPELTIHGVTKPVAGAQYKIAGKKVEATLQLELLDFGIERPAFMGIKVVDAVAIKVEFDIND